MNRVRLSLTIVVALVASALTVRPAASQPSGPTQQAWTAGWPAPQQRRGRRGGEDGVYKAAIEPHWLGDSSQFWYRNDLRGGQIEYVLIDAAKNTRQPAFDHQRLADALSAATGGAVAPDRLDLERLALSPELKEAIFDFDSEHFTCDLDHYELRQLDKTESSEEERSRRRRGPSGNRGDRAKSPDGRWTASVRDHNLVLQHSEGDEETQLTDDGVESCRYGMLSWSPDSKRLAAFEITPGDDKQVHLLESSPKGGGRAVLHSRGYPLPGDRMSSFELSLFDPETGDHTKPAVDVIDFGWPRLEWRPDGKSLVYTHVDRGHQRLRVMKIDSHTGEPLTVVDEKSETFIWTAHTENLRLDLVNWLEDSEEVIYVSEADGWRHLYLYDASTGELKNQITQGEYVVRGIDRIDEQSRQIWFSASGKNPGQDPYFLHHYRADFDGTNLVALTEGDGDHRVQYSPDRGYLIDTYSRVDSPPVHELRSCADGLLVRKLEEADISELAEKGWRPLEVFHTKGRDGVTDIWGVISLPKDFDPSKTYPVIESIYAGPQGAFVPKSFSVRNRYGSIADLGFVVVQIDGMGTANRSKAFHDVCWHDLKDAGFPDRISWMKAAAKGRPYMDLSRVGVYGGSAGGQNATGALLFHPDFYKVGASGCGCHDNRMDKASWNEQWMGYPVGPQYAECSNIDNAHRLEGKLMLIVGEMDDNVPPESTYRLVDALIRADKDFDFVLVPGAGHGMGGGYGYRRMQEFLVEHLIDNAEQGPSTSESAEPTTAGVNTAESDTQGDGAI
ncbi:Prolyl tripeptidyl peptidase precursor [Posidoniimonas polymericola]|uniref:Prolyl tripeptidyl peptidase n=1 Tax=Posidoniimonas polymericola TaxID=2528002 RepID=A0A5C5YLF0_9BACT|nr:S9 family peptidase [Posidoniimonas polymericola]TWT75714.1 Prolyl tripeptidyl peptidase precursor [Posidoniimonas polymericola]